MVDMAARKDRYNWQAVSLAMTHWFFPQIPLAETATHSYFPFGFVKTWNCRQTGKRSSSNDQILKKVGIRGIYLKTLYSFLAQASGSIPCQLVEDISTSFFREDFFSPVELSCLVILVAVPEDVLQPRGEWNLCTLAETFLLSVGSICASVTSVGRPVCLPILTFWVSLMIFFPTVSIENKQQFVNFWLKKYK